MGLAIAWRNPRPVHAVQRCTRVSENDSCARYFVEELIGGVPEGAWIDLSTMEILRGGNVLKPCAEKPAIDASRGAGAKRRTPPTSTAPLAPVIGLWPLFILASRNAQYGTIKAPGAKKTPPACSAVQSKPQSPNGHSVGLGMNADMCSARD